MFLGKGREKDEFQPRTTRKAPLHALLELQIPVDDALLVEELKSDQNLEPDDLSYIEEKHKRRLFELP